MNNLNKNSEKNYNFTTDWFHPNAKKWEETLFHLKRKKNKILEIGVFEGRSTVWIIENLLKNPESKLFCIDIFEKFLGSDYNYEEIFLDNIKKSCKQDQVTVLKSNSFDALVYLNSEKENEFDFIYIDGSHSSCDVLSDAILSWRLLKDQGIMIFDDYEWDYFEEEFNNPRISIDSFLRCFQTEIEILHKHYQVAIRKVKNKYLITKREDKSLT